MDKTSCLTCQHWRLTVADKAGRLKLHEMAVHKFGSCEKVGSWHYTPRGHECEKHKLATPTVIKKREKELHQCKH